MEIFVYIRTKDGDEFLKTQQELLLTVLDEIAAAGTALADPRPRQVSSTPRVLRTSRRWTRRYPVGSGSQQSQLTASPTDLSVE